MTAVDELIEADDRVQRARALVAQREDHTTARPRLTST